MAFDVVMFGTLNLRPRNVEDWLSSPVESTDFPWLDEVGGVEVVQDTPEALLSLLSNVVTCAPHELFEVTLHEGKLTVSCFASEDTFRETSLAMALLFASSAAFGGLGELCFVGYQGIRFGERLLVRGGQGTFQNVTNEALSRLELHHGYLELDRKIHERFDKLVGRRPPAPVDPTRARWVVHPFTGRQVRVADDSQPRSEPTP